MNNASSPSRGRPVPVPQPPKTRPVPVMLSGADAAIATLERLGVTDVFGLPGGAVLPLYDRLLEAEKINHILVRHEQGAGHAAEGYALASGGLGVCVSTSGPGATNLVTAIGDAYMDSVPMLAITGQVFSTLMGTDAFQEADIRGITMPITKHSFLVTKAEDIPAAIAAAYEIATTGRPGPVLVDITKDAQINEVPFIWPPKYELPGYHPVVKAHSKQIQAAAKLLMSASKPLFYVGGGVIRAKASESVRNLAELLNAPVVTTLTARGAFPDSHPQMLGMPGMHGTVPAVLGLQESDVIFCIGARFDDRVTGKVDEFAPNAKIIHVDIDPAEISKIRFADVPIVGDADVAATDLFEVVQQRLADGKKQADVSQWWDRLNGLREEFPRGYAPTTDGKLIPQRVIERISDLTGPDAIYAAGVGQHQMWSAQFVRFEKPGTWLNSGGAGTMGYSVPAAMGAQVACPDSVVWAIDGDGCFQMTNQELATCVINNIPIKVAIINNSSLGMVRQWQTLFYDGRYSHTNLQPHQELIPDFVKLAEAYGCAARRVREEDEVDEAIKWALSVNDRPVVLDFIVSSDAMVWPMVPQGVSNSFVQYAREHSPAFEEA